jgi:hypothetical protein
VPSRRLVSSKNCKFALAGGGRFQAFKAQPKVVERGAYNVSRGVSLGFSESG